MGAQQRTKIHIYHHHKVFDYLEKRRLENVLYSVHKTIMTFFFFLGCQSTTVLLAKVEEILVKKPTNKPKAETFPKNAISDDLNDFFKSKTPRITAKIETIYDKQSSVKIRESNRLKQFSSSQEIQRKPRVWKSMFGDINSSNFGKVKDDFFQRKQQRNYCQIQWQWFNVKNIPFQLVVFFFRIT